MDKQNYELAEEDYINGMKYKEIAEKYNVSINTVKSWKTRYKWCKDKKGMHTKSKKVCTQNKKSAGAKKNNECGIKEPIADEVKEVMNNEELTDKQRLFCIFYSKCFNATKAYLKAYTCTYETANAEGYKLLVNPCIKKQIDELTKIRFNKEALKSGVLQKYIDIAFADLGDYLKFGKKTKGVWTKDKDGVNTPVIDPDTGQQKIKEYSYVDLKESISVDTSLITEVSEGKDGIKIKLADKMKALDFLNKHLNLLSDEDKIKLDLEYRKLQNAKLENEVTRANKNNKKDGLKIVIDYGDEDGDS
ncbi:terminase small subunit [Clostridium butyricum]|uniref:terminase small subunit n=1 Tax=Clostridium butyricum TaxID=1492 RepID=UPI00040BE1BA|nr:terminase small subunit [Clostridium butyricum]MDU1340225.1 terminase small subunit [Clostridium butyricum]DAV13367.1 MAG TPA: Terminase small subunit [Caudoviricetes sp.]